MRLRVRIAREVHRDHRAAALHDAPRIGKADDGQKARHAHLILVALSVRLCRILDRLLGGPVLLLLQIVGAQGLAVFAGERFDRFAVNEKDVADALLGAPDFAVLVIKRELLLLTKGVLFAGAIQCFLIRFHAA